jgi:hypothetical protein
VTLSTVVSRVTYPGAGAVGPFTYPFRIFAYTDLLVTKKSTTGVESTLTYGTQFTATGAGDVAGTLTLTTALAVGETLVIRRELPITQPVSIRNQGAYFPSTIEDEFDRLTMLDQQQQDEIDRSLKLAESLDPTAYVLTLPNPEAGKVMTGTGTGFTMSALDSSAVALPGQGRTVPTLSAFLANNAIFNVLDYAAGVTINTDVNNALTAMNLCRDSIPTVGAAFGGIMYMPAGVYKCLGKFVGKRNVHVMGENASIGPGTTYNGTTVIRGVHTDRAVVDLLGIHAVAMSNITIYGDSVSVPKTGLLCARDSGNSAGYHIFRNVSVQGYFSKAAVYSIASEENLWDKLSIYLYGGGAKHCFYTSQGDGLAVDAAIVGSSNIQGTFLFPWFFSDVNDATASLIYINAGASTWGWNFFGGYLLPKAGAYVTIMTGQVDGADTPGQFSFIGMNGEKNAGGLEPITGFDLLVAGARILHGLQVQGCSFELNNAAGRMVRQAATLTLKGCDVRCRARGGIGSSLIAAQIVNSRINDGFSDIHQFYGDLDLYGKLFLSSDPSMGLYFSQGGPKIRASLGANQLQVVDNAGAAFYDLAVKDLITTDAAALVKSQVALNNGAAAGAGTITNAPAAGNPTKWIPINDNGTVRYIPAW